MEEEKMERMERSQKDQNRKLTNPDVRQEFFQEVLSLTEDFDGTWEKVVAILIKASEKTCGPTKGGRG